MSRKVKEKNTGASQYESKKRSAEVTAYHTHILRMSLSLEDNRSYWENYRSAIERKKLPTVAFEERWFGNKTMARVRLILINFRYRYDAYPMPLKILCKWRPKDPKVRQNICHWHLQLADPLYRIFTGDFLENRRKHPTPRIDRDTVSRWLADMFGDKWSVSTANRIAENLISSAAEAGLCTAKLGTRTLTYPQVERYSLAYLLYFLRHVSFEGSLLMNPYLKSVGLSEGMLEQRLRNLPGLAFNRMGNLQDFNWSYDDLESWATNALSLNMEDSV